jgi:DNA primase
MDPADFVEAEGKEAMQATIDASVALLRFALDRRLARWDLDQTEQLDRALNDVISLLVPVKGSLLATDYINYLADMFKVDYELIATALETAKPPAASRVPGNAGQAGQAFEGAATQAAQYSSGIKKENNKSIAMEIELLFLFIEHPGVRRRLAEAFGRITWSTPEHESVAKTLMTLDEKDDPDDMLAGLIVKMPDASSLLSHARLSAYNGVSPNRLAGILMFNIREDQLKRAIKSETITLRRLESELTGQSGATGRQGSSSDDGQKDEIFKHIAELQQELNELRRKYNMDGII